MTDLLISKVLEKYDTDKVSHHSYGDTYDKIFSKFNRQAKLNILEVGTQKGGSLLAWKEYFPNATVTGVDIVDVVLPKYRSKDIRYIVSDIKEWRTDETFDIIIDDGSHHIHDVLFVIKHFHPKLNKGGVMIVEDVQDVTWDKLINIPHESIDLRGVRGNYDDYMFILWK